MLRRIIWVALALATVALAQKYDGPVPAKPDLPYLKHGDTLIPTEAVEAKEEKKKDTTVYSITPANSPVKTPLASPILLMKSDKLAARNLQLFKFEVKNGHRELAFTAKHPAQPIRIVVTKLSSDGVWRIEVDESLEPGEYSLSPSDSNQAFCFQVF
ncbi:MAG: hypothetical protein WDO73_05645 [Ignavibacteriota bacterium]